LAFPESLPALPPAIFIQLRSSGLQRVENIRLENSSLTGGRELTAKKVVGRTYDRTRAFFQKNAARPNSLKKVQGINVRMSTTRQKLPSRFKSE
jgi:hypothetical protein